MSSGKPSRTKQAIHGAHGFLAGLLAIDYTIISIFLYAQFFLYEYFEETKIRDEMYYELMEWATGFALGLSTSLALKFLEVKLF